MLSLQLSVEGHCPGEDILVEAALPEAAHAVDGIRAEFHAAVLREWLRHGDHRMFCPPQDGGYPRRPPDAPGVVLVGIVAMAASSLDGGPEEMSDRDPRLCLMREVAGGTATDIEGRLAQLAALHPQEHA